MKKSINSKTDPKLYKELEEEVDLHLEDHLIEIKMVCQACSEVDSTDAFISRFSEDKKAFIKRLIEDGWKEGTSKEYCVTGLLCPKCKQKEERADAGKRKFIETIQKSKDLTFIKKSIVNFTTLLEENLESSLDLEELNEIYETAVRTGVKND